MTKIGADIIADVFVEQGIEKIYMYAGGTIVPTLNAAIKRGIRYFCARHEQGAGYAALAYARLTQKPQVVMVTSGPGATNIVTCVADAYFDSTPLIVITGQVGTGDMRGSLNIRQRGFQEVDSLQMMQSITKAAFLVTDVNDMRAIFEEAFFLANDGRKGPVVIDLPMDIQRALIENEPRSFKSITVAKNNSISNDQLAILSQWFYEAKRPVLLVGQGVLAAGAVEALTAFATTFSIPVVMSLLGLSAFPSSHELSMGFLGHTGTRYANLAIHNADLVIVLGARLDVRQTGSKTQDFVPNGMVVRIDIDPAELEHSRVHCELAINADCGDFLVKWSSTLNRQRIIKQDLWLTQTQAWKKQFSLSHYGETNSLYPQAIIEMISQKIGDHSCIVATGVGSHQQWVARHFDLYAPKRRWLTSGGHGAMGYDLPSAIGAGLNFPDDIILCFVGDGSFQINMQELAAAVEYAVPVKIIILDNQRLGIVSQFQKLNWDDDPSTGEKWNPPFDEIARAYGIAAFSISTPNEMKATIEAFLQAVGPALLHCHIKKDEDVVPMLMANHSMNNMWPYSDEPVA